jgi:peptidoglycan/xylan/chitin deacetylase (PgdA/CDA1 family)
MVSIKRALAVGAGPAPTIGTWPRQGKRDKPIRDAERESGMRAVDRRTATAWLLASPALMATGPAAVAGPAGRVLAVSSAGGPRFGIRSYPGTLPLADGEVVLTFDDGPLPGPTERVLDALAAAGVRATFFVIGRNARANAPLLRRIAAGGHTIANHTLNHLWTLRQRSTETGIREIVEGEDAIRQALGRPIAPFFRFPGFADTPDLLAELARRDRSVWGADLWASDWNAMTPERQLALVTGRLGRQRRGIVLFHDVRPQTAAMIPAFLGFLASGGYRAVHAVPA